MLIKGIETPEINLFWYFHLISDKSEKQSIREKIASCTEIVLGKLNIHA